VRGRVLGCLAILLAWIASEIPSPVPFPTDAVSVATYPDRENREDGQVHHYGIVRPGTKVSHTFELHPRGGLARPEVVRSWTGCGCSGITVSTSAGSVVQQATGMAVTLVVDTRGRNGPFDSSAFVELRGDPRPLVFTMKGIVHPEPEVFAAASSPLVVLGGPGPDAPWEATVTLLVRAAPSTVAHGIAVKAPPYVRCEPAGVRETSIGEVWSCAFRVSLDPQDVSRARHGTLNFLIPPDDLVAAARELTVIVRPGATESVGVCPPARLVTVGRESREVTAIWNLHPQVAGDRLLEARLAGDDPSMTLLAVERAGRGLSVRCRVRLLSGTVLVESSLVVQHQGGATSMAPLRLLVVGP